MASSATITINNNKSLNAGVRPDSRPGTEAGVRQTLCFQGSPRKAATPAICKWKTTLLPLEQGLQQASSEDKQEEKWPPPIRVPSLSAFPRALAQPTALPASAPQRAPRSPPPGPLEAPPPPLAGAGARAVQSSRQQGAAQGFLGSALGLRGPSSPGYASLATGCPWRRGTRARGPGFPAGWLRPRSNHVGDLVPVAQPGAEGVPDRE